MTEKKQETEETKQETEDERGLEIKKWFAAALVDQHLRDQGLPGLAPEPLMSQLLEGTGVSVPDEMRKMRSVLSRETDRGCALVAAAYLDGELEKLLGAFFVEDKDATNELLGSSRPLGTFSARVQASLCLGLIDRIVYRDINLIRKIRNDFAHLAKDMSFETPEVRDRCRELALAMPLRDDPRRMFTSAVMAVAAVIHKSCRENARRQSPVVIRFDRDRQFKWTKEIEDLMGEMLADAIDPERRK